MNNDIYEVSRAEYTSLVETIKSEAREIMQYISHDYKYIDIYSKNTHQKLTSRVTYVGDSEFLRSEKYYIYNLPQPEERTADIPKYKLELQTREEVQAFIDVMARMRKEQDNERTIPKCS